MSPQRLVRRRPFWVLAVAVVVAIGLGAYAANLLTSDNELLCEAVNANRATVRNLLVSARNQTPKTQLNARARRFYAQQIAEVKPLDCGNFNRDSLRRGGSTAERGDASPGKAKQPP